MTTRTRILMMASALAVTAAACGNAAETIAEEIAEEAAGGDVDIDVDGSEINVETSEGTFNMGGDLPEDWPDDAPTPAGCDVQTAQSFDTADGYGAVVHFDCEGGDPQTIFDQVKAEAERQGWTIDSEGNHSSDDITNINLQATKDDGRELIVTVTLTSDILNVAVSIQGPPS